MVLSLGSSLMIDLPCVELAAEYWLYIKLIGRLLQLDVATNVAMLC